MLQFKNILLTLFFSFTLLFSSSMVVEAQGISQPPVFSEDLSARLSAHLDAVQREQSTGRVTSGFVWLGFGALGGTLGYFELTSDPLGVGPRAAPVLGYLGVGYAALGVGASIYSFLVPSKAEQVWTDYSRLPATTDDEKIRKFASGEAALRSLSDYYKTSRIVSGGLLIGVGAAEVLMVPGSSSYLSAGILVGSGIAELLIESIAEREWRYYQEERSGR